MSRSTQQPKYAAFTILELMISITVLSVVFAASLGFLIHILRAKSLNMVQTSLDSDVQQVAESIKRSIRLSSINHMYFYPEDGDAFTAVSYPVPVDTNNDNIVEMDENMSIVWGETFIYHPWPVDRPTQLRRTLFSPKDNSLTDDERREQLADVVKEGNGENTHNKENGITRIIANNLVDWHIRPQGKTFDFYSVSDKQVNNLHIGGVQVFSGDNTIKFKTIQANSNNVSGCHNIWVDTLTLTPSGLPVDMTSLLPSTNYFETIPPFDSYISSGFWNNGHLLTFPATDTNQWFELSFYNDQWYETLFYLYGSEANRTRSLHNNELQDNVLQLSGNEAVWSAEQQAGASSLSTNTYPSRAKAAIRVIIKGNFTPDDNGDGCRILFKAAADDLVINSACMSEITSTDFDAYNHHQITFNGSNKITIPAGGEIYSDPIDIWIDDEKKYAVSYLIAANTGGNPYIWNSGIANTNSFIIPGSVNPTDNALTEPNWKTTQPAMIPHSGIFGVAKMKTLIL